MYFYTMFHTPYTMKNTIIFFLLTLVCSTLNAQTCPTCPPCTSTNEADLTSISDGDVICIDLNGGSSNINGTIGNGESAIICVQNGITFNFLNNNLNPTGSGELTIINNGIMRTTNFNVRGGQTVTNCGQWDNAGSLTVDGGVENYGSTNISGNINVNTNSEQFDNYGDMTISGNATFNSNNDMYNEGNLTTTGSFTLNSNANFCGPQDGSCGRFVVNGNAIINNNAGFGDNGNSSSANSPCGALDLCNSAEDRTGFDTDNNGEIGPDVTYCDCTNTPLPVSFLSFEAIATQNAVLLRWQTASEEENSYFAIERSTDGRIFQEIGQVRGSGTTYERQNYTWMDENPLHGGAYYRLRQVDYDGAFSFSKVRYVKWFRPQDALQVYPNPAQDELTVLINPELRSAQLQLTSLSGEVVAEKFSTELTDGKIVWRGLAHLQGFYVLRLRHERFVQQVKVLFR